MARPGTTRAPHYYRHFPAWQTFHLEPREEETDRDMCIDMPIIGELLGAISSLILVRKCTMGNSHISRLEGYVISELTYHTSSLASNAYHNQTHRAQLSLDEQVNAR
jgi:hypothetical protein